MDVISTWRLAYLYPEVCRAHAEFGGDLGEMLREYHRQVMAELEFRIETSQKQPNAAASNVNENGAKAG